MPDVGTLEEDLRSARQQLADAGRDKAAMSESLRAMRAAVAEALDAMKAVGDEKAANQALAEDLRSTRQQLEDAGRDKAAMSQSLHAMQAAVAEALGATKRTDDEKAANQALEAHLRSTRQRLEDAGRDKAAAFQSLRSMEAAVADREGKLKAAEAQGAVLAASLTAAKRDAIAASETKQIGDKSVNQALEADLRSTRQRLEDAGRDKAATSQALRAMQAAAVDREGKLKAAEAQTAVLAASLATARHDAMTAAVATKQAGDDKGVSQALEADLRSTRQRLEDADRDKAAKSQVLRAMQAAAVDRDGKLKAAEAQTSVLTAGLAAAKHDATEASAATKRIGDDKAAADQSLRALQVVVLDREGKLRAAEAQTAVLAASLATARHEAMAASDMAKRTGDDKATKLALEAELRSTRQRLQNADKDKAASSQALQTMQTAAADSQAKLEAAEAQTSVLTASLAAAKHDAMTASETTKLADDDKAAASQSLSTMQAAIADREAKLEAAEARSAALTASLATVEHDAAMASAATKEASGERAANLTLQAELRSTRQRLQNADKDKAASSQALQAMQAAAADSQVKLEAAEARTSVLTASLAVAKHDAMAAAEARAAALAASLATVKHDAAVTSAATKEAGDEKAANLALEADLRSTRRQLEETGRDKAAAFQSLRTMQAAVADREGKLEAAEARAAVLTTRLATARQDAAVAPDATDRSAAKGRSAKSASIGQALADPTPSTASNFGLLSNRAPSNVVLQYRAGNPIARDKATSLRSILNSSGIVSTNVSEASNLPPGVRVTYYYKQDRQLAKQVSKSVTSSEPTQKHSAHDQTPLPGTVEVSVGG